MHGIWRSLARINIQITVEELKTVYYQGGVVMEPEEEAAASRRLPGRSGYLLLRSEAFKRDGTLVIKLQRVFCVVNEDEFWCVKAEVLEKELTGGTLEDRARQLTPLIRIRLAECLAVEMTPYTIEESIEKMRLRKKNDKPLAFRLIRFCRYSQPARKVPKTNSTITQGIKFPVPARTVQPGEDVLEFGAEASGSVRGWISYLQKATWACGVTLPLEEFPPQKPHALRILLMPGLAFPSRETALVIHVDLYQHSAQDIANYMQETLGVAPGQLRFVVQASDKKPRAELGRAHLNTTLEHWLQGREVSGIPGNVIEVWSASKALSTSAGYTAVTEIVRKISY